MYRVKKKLNNNVALVTKDEQEYVVSGKGIGFGKNKNDHIDDELIDQIYVLQNETDFAALQQMFIDIPGKYVKLANDIISIGEKMLQKELSFSLLVALADHINIAFHHAEKDIIIANPLQWEIESFYPIETSIGKIALDIIYQDTKIALPQAEATAIAMHFVNANNDIDRMEKTAKMTKIIAEVVDIINKNYDITLSKEDIHYQRFLRHLRHFLIKQEKQTQDTSDDDILLNFVKQNFYDTYSLAIKITDYIENKYHLKSTQDEISYLAIHLARIAQE